MTRACISAFGKESREGEKRNLAGKGREITEEPDFRGGTAQKGIFVVRKGTKNAGKEKKEKNWQGERGGGGGLSS